MIHFGLCLCVSPVEKIQSQWDEVQGRLQNRRQQLHEMLKDSTQWLEAKQEAEQVLEQAKAKLESWKEISYTVDALKKQNTELKVIIEKGRFVLQKDNQNIENVSTSPK